MFPTPNDDLPPVCEACGYCAHWLGDHFLSRHGWSLIDYETLYPGAAWGSRKLWARYEKAHPPVPRTGPNLDAPLNVEFGGIRFQVTAEVPANACLPMPAHYHLPTSGEFAVDVQDVAIALKQNRSIWVWGPPGTGKDAVFSAFCAMTRRPSILFQIVQGADITSWRYTRGFDATGTYWEEGKLLKALRDGYETGSGLRVPYLLVFSDFDRATRAQAEELRQILDSIQGRVSGPSGQTWPLFPGTTIVATANSSGGGDPSGKFISANPVDMSILDRFERKIYFHGMSPKDEKKIVAAKFPELSRRYPSSIEQMFEATKSVREAIKNEIVFAEWGHRSVCNWASAVQDLMESLPELPGDELLRRGMRVVLDGLPDPDTREGVKRLIDPHIKGGAVDPGSTSHISPNPLR